MRLTTGIVVSGKIVVLGEVLAEGMVVTVLVPDAQETFTLGAEAEAALLESIEEADRGEVISDAILLLELASQAEADLKVGRVVPQKEALARVRSRLRKE